MNFRLLLLPFTLIYSLIMLIRNKLYDANILKHTAFTRPVICVGNITVGGTGKTPFIEYLLLLLSNRNPSIVSRGYHRATHGLVGATPTSTAAEIGDEPSQMHAKYPDVPMVVSENRALGINYLLNNTSAQLVLMDDGFQHRSAQAGFYICMADYARPMWSDYTFPAGNLREPWHGYRRADIVVVNKCPLSLEQNPSEAMAIRRRFNKPVFFTAIDYGNLKTISGNDVDIQLTNVIAIAGIGRPEPFFQEVERRAANVIRLAFPDHYNFSQTDIDDIKKQCRETNSVIVTTEKDAQRLKKYGLDNDLGENNIVYLPIVLRVLFEEKEKLNKIIIDYVREFD